MTEFPIEPPSAAKTESSPTPPIDQSAHNHKRKHSVIWVTLILLALGVLWLALWWFDFRFYESTDDAYVNGNRVNVTPVISGTPIAFFADETDLVQAGQLLVQLDETEYQIAYERELATLASIVLQVKQLNDKVKINATNVQNKRVLLEKARYDFENRKSLIHTRAVSNEDFTHARDTLSSAELDLKQAVYQLQESQDALGKGPIEKHPLIEKQKSAVLEAFYKLKHCSIHAPVKGHIAQRAVEVGQCVNPSTFLMAIVPSDYVWIDANFKETQLRNMRIGQPASVTLDLYGSSVVYEGKVFGIGMGTGSVFSLIPPQNATGNWIKIVQRVPVRIVVDAKTVQQYPLRLGLSANVEVNIRDTTLPLLASTPAEEKAITSTSVFKLDLSAAEKRMHKLIHEYFESVQLDSRAS